MPPTPINNNNNPASPINHSASPRVHVKDGEVFANSRDVAGFFGKRHDNVVRDINTLLMGLLKSEDTPSFNLFKPSPYVASNGETYGSYDMTKDGFTLLVMGYTGAKAMQVSGRGASPEEALLIHLGCTYAGAKPPVPAITQRETRMNALIVRPLDALAQRINEEQYQIEHHAKGMLLAAKAAGEALSSSGSRPTPTSLTTPPVSTCWLPSGQD